MDKEQSQTTPAERYKTDTRVRQQRSSRAAGAPREGRNYHKAIFISPGSMINTIQSSKYFIALYFMGKKKLGKKSSKSFYAVLRCSEGEGIS